jgi:hypothetical protein
MAADMALPSQAKAGSFGLTPGRQAVTLQIRPAPIIPGVGRFFMRAPWPPPVRH